MKKIIVLMMVIFSATVFIEAQSKNVKLNREFALGANQKASIKADKLNIEFVSVLEDSRCPVGVDCVWAGNAKVQIKISRGKAAAKTFEINTGLDPKIITFENYKIELVNLNPIPKADGDMSKAKYTANFIVRK